MRVLKFGGTSVADAERLKLVSDIVIAKQADHNGLCVVVSAFSGMTDLLLNTVSLAQANDNSYTAHYQRFIAKVHEVAQELLDDSSYTSIKDELDENHVRKETVLSYYPLISVVKATLQNTLMPERSLRLMTVTEQP